MSDKQLQVIDAIQGGEDVAVVGSAGTGKSFCIKKGVEGLNTIIVAPTAVAAMNVDGVTAHSAFSLGIGIQTEKDLARVKPQMYDVFGRHSSIDCLWIDEAFNLRADYLDAIDHKLRLIRDSQDPFGGIQVVLSGDPLQCSPIVSGEERRYLRRNYRKGNFIFNSKVWEALQPNVTVLEKVYRNTNREQLDALQAIRIQDVVGGTAGKAKWQEAIDYINSIATIGEYSPSSDLAVATYKADAFSINTGEYNKIKAPEKAYHGVVKGSFKESDMLVDKILRLKVGAKVATVMNNPSCGYINGTRGTIVSLKDDSVLIETEYGCTISVEPHVFEQIEYTTLGGKLSKNVVGTFKQLPLTLAYAMTISKSQSLTLDSMFIDLGKRSFGEGMLYVALSRVTDLSNAKLAREITHEDVVVNKKALEWVKKYT